MTLQTISQLILLLGVVLTALGGYGSYHFGKIEEKEKERISDQKQNELNEQITILQANTSQINTKLELIYQAARLREEVWTQVEMKNVPPGVTDYLLLLFRSDKGRITGNVRIKGSQETSSFSTTANNRIPVALRNLWVPDQGQYKVPTVMEFSITEKTNAEASLSIYTQGYIDSRGTEPH